MMARKYAEVWKRLAKNEAVSITCPARGVKAVSAAIYNEKYRYTKARKDTDLPSFGRVEIKKTPIKDKPGMLRLDISIKYSGDNL